MEKELILKIQRNEMTEYFIYKKLAEAVKIKEQGEILSRIADEELAHCQVFKEFSREDVLPDKVKILFYVTISRIFGLNFGLRLMESGEDNAQEVYGSLKSLSPKIESIINDEEKHERQLIGLIDEERLKYVSSIVLGLNDALVELTGALAGFTLALQSSRLIGMVGLITGLAAAMSMASSEYLSTKHEETDKDPLKASIYTGIAYVGTVLFLIFPYFLFNNVFVCLAFTIANALLVMFVFTYYSSVAKELPFRNRFLEMAAISLGIAAISFCIGLAVRKVFGVEV